MNEERKQMDEAESGIISGIGNTPLRVVRAIELAAVVGREFEPGRWLAVTQEEIDRFVALTGDRNWIHTDTERAARELPIGKTIVPGQLLLALVPALLQETYVVTGGQQSMVAAIRNVRFSQEVHPGDRFRLRARLTLVEQHAHFVQVEASCDFELESAQKALMSQRTDVYLLEGATCASRTRSDY